MPSHLQQMNVVERKLGAMNQQVLHPPCKAGIGQKTSSRGAGVIMDAEKGGHLDLGLSRIILGTAAQRNPSLVEEACKLFPGRVVVGIDARNGMVAVQGWAEVTDVRAVDLAKKLEDFGVAAIIYTDISRDGMMQGPNIEATRALAEAIRIPVIASGGVSSLNDIENLMTIEGDLQQPTVLMGDLLAVIYLDDKPLYYETFADPLVARGFPQANDSCWQLLFSGA